MPNEIIIHDVYLPLVQRALFKKLQDLISKLTESQKLAAVQILLAQIKTPNKLIKLEFINGFDDKLHTVFALASFLSTETLKETAIQILEEPIDQNE